MWNIAVGICAVLFWFYTDNIVPAVAAGVLALIPPRSAFMLTVMLSVTVIGFCLVYFWGELVMKLDDESTRVQIFATVGLMFSAFIKGTEGFR